MPYVHFTEEQKQRANSVDLEEFLLRSGERLLPSGREKRMAAIAASPYAAASGMTMRRSGAAGRWPSSSTSVTCPIRRRCSVC